MWDRRRLLYSLAALPGIGTLPALASRSRGAPGSPQRDYFRELGVRPFINAAGTYTALSASLMPPEVLEAMAYAAGQYVALDELHDRVGERIASLLGCEAAMVTAGAASALTLGTAAILTGKDPEKIAQLPDLTGMKKEVILQKSHRFAYDHAVRNCGVRMVEVETVTELEEAIHEETALMLFLNAANFEGQIPDVEFVRLGKKHGIPTFNDAAADVPPVENLWKYIQMGFDLVTFSGGKGIRGPQSTGLLLGRRDLIEAARLNTSPNANTIGRGMKVNKEEMLGLLVALEMYLEKDHQQEWKEWEEWAEQIRDAARSVRGIESEIFVPEIANHVPHVRIWWDQQQARLDYEGVAEALRQGEPRIEIKTDKDGLRVGVWMMQPGDEQVVSRRLKEVLKEAV